MSKNSVSQFKFFQCYISWIIFTLTGRNPPDVNWTVLYMGIFIVHEPLFPAENKCLYLYSEAQHKERPPNRSVKTP